MSNKLLIIRDVRPPHAQWKSDGVVKSWIQGDFADQIDLRLAECADGTRPSPVDGFVYKELRHGDNDVIASYGPIVGPQPGTSVAGYTFDEFGRLI